MKKIILFIILFLLPVISFAEETKAETSKEIIEQELSNNTDFQNLYEEYITQEITDSKELKTTPFMEYHFNFFSSSEIDIEYMDEIKEIQLNSSVQTSLSFGFEFENGRVSINPAYMEIEDEEKILSIKFIFDYMPIRPYKRTQPYISLMVSANSIDIEYADISENTFGYGIGSGILYNINDNIFVNLGISYSFVEFDIEDTSMEISGFAFNTGFGYRF